MLRRDPAFSPDGTIPRLLLLLCVAVPFLACLPNGWVDWDDPVMVTGNPLVQSIGAASLKAIFTTFITNAWHPLVFLAYSLEFRLFGADPTGYHLVSILLHLAAVSAIFSLMGELAGWRASFAGALLFGLHPARVEPVAWASGQKDLLAGFFFTAALLAYWRYVARNSRRWYLLAICLAALANLSKGTTVSLPLVLPLLDWLRRRTPTRSMLLDKIPFVVMAAGTGIAAILARRAFEAGVGEPHYPALYRVSAAGYRLVWYHLRRLVDPFGGTPELYPDMAAEAFWRGLLTWGVPAAILGVVVLAAARRERLVPFGAAFLLITLTPSLGTITYGYTADRFSYIPSVGVALLAGVGLSSLERRWREGRWRAVPAGVLVGVALVLGTATWNRCGVWRDSVSLWTDAIVRFGARPGGVNLGVAHVDRGRARWEAGDPRRALEDLDRGLAIIPDYPGGMVLRARVLIALGELDRARGDLAGVLSGEPSNVEARALLDLLP